MAFAPDGTLWHGSYPLTATLATIGFEAQAIATALAAPSLAVEPLLVHGSTIPWDEQCLGGVAVLPAADWSPPCSPSHHYPPINRSPGLPAHQ